MRHRLYAKDPCGGDVSPAFGLQAWYCGKCRRQFSARDVMTERLVWAPPQHGLGVECTWCLPLPEAEGLDPVVF